MPQRTAIPAVIRLAVMERDGWRCRYCHDQEGPFHLDHVTPWAKGGASTPENLVTACVPCNLAKGVSQWIVPPVTEVAELTPRRELIKQAMTRRLTLERIAAEFGHVPSWRSCSKRTTFWKCSCGQQGTFPRSQVRGLPPKIRWHLMDAIGVIIETDPVELAGGRFLSFV